ncbi:MAG: hypothetical protein H8M99_06555 [Gloeobacteraceae cyanobacterium ES-bin-144]|nr:hypothetical protein [Verrucomicrobiales bacterium]
MKTKTAPTTGTNTKKKIRPVTLTIEGDLAATIRKGAKQIGFRADTWARMLIRDGDLMISHTEEAKEYRLAMALSELHECGRRFVEVLSDEECKRRREEKRASAA